MLANMIFFIVFKCNLSNGMTHGCLRSKNITECSMYCTTRENVRIHLKMVKITEKFNTTLRMTLVKYYGNHISKYPF